MDLTKNKRVLSLSFTRVKHLLLSTRPYSFTASVIPVCVGAAYAATLGEHHPWGSLPWIFATMILLHAGTNLVNDYGDYLRGIDCGDNQGKHSFIVQNIFSARRTLFHAGIFFAGAVVTALPIIFEHGYPVVLLGITGLLGGFFYTFPPVAYKYRAMGDACVFFLMGILPSVGTFYVLMGRVTVGSVLVSLPVATLVTAILHGNNLRDIERDRRAGISTVALRLGFSASKWLFVTLLCATYLIPALLIVYGTLPGWTALIVLSLPAAGTAGARVVRAQSPDASSLKIIDRRIAALHGIFGALFTLSLIVPELIS